MYTKKAHIHFVGIGGIGMSGIATILRYQGYTISGCDTDLDQQSIHDLRSIDCSIHQGNNTQACKNSSIDILVYSSAIDANNPEILAAQQRGIPTIPRALMLAELMRTKYSVAIAGSHGKTTTTSLISHILIEAHLDPTVIIGGRLKNISTNARLGNGDFLIAEADESDRSLLHLKATLAIVTSIDLEHLETYADLEDVKHTFKQFISNLPFYGKVLVCIDDPNIRAILPIPHIKTIKYGIEHSADIYATNICLKPSYSTFTVWKKGHQHPLGSIQINMPGKHNVLNSLAAIALSDDLNIPFSTITDALQSFKGIERRFSYQGLFKGAEIFDDYGHHPQEILNTLITAKNRSKRRLVVIFQPHRYTRTDKLWDQFVDTFLQCDLDHLIITDIYPASETPIPDITSQNLAKAIKQHNPTFDVSYAPYDPHFTSIIHQMSPLIQPDDLVLLLGAGKINKLPNNLGKSFLPQSS